MESEENDGKPRDGWPWREPRHRETLTRGVTGDPPGREPRHRETLTRGATGDPPWQEPRHRETLTRGATTDGRGATAADMGHDGLATGLAEHPGEVALEQQGERIEDQHDDDGDNDLQEDVVVEGLGTE